MPRLERMRRTGSARAAHFGTGLLRSAALAAGLVLGSASVARADDRAVERFDTRDGLPNADATAIAQDSAGFIWVGTSGGLARFDGERFVPWAVGDIGGRVVHLATASESLYAAEDYAYVWRIDGASTVRLRGPDGEPIVGATDLAVDDDDVLWVAVDGRLLRLGSDEIWSEPFAACLDRERVRTIATVAGGPLHFATSTGIWRGTAGCAERIAAADHPFDMLVTPGGDLHVIELGGRWWRLRGDERTLLRAPTLQGRALVMRGDDVWAAHSGELAVLRPGSDVQAWGAEGGMGRGGPMLVDHEHTLWVATPNGLLHYFEPDTIITTLRDGDATISLLYLTQVDDAVLVTSWSGGAVVPLAESQPTIEGYRDEARFDVQFHERACRDEEGRGWGTVYRNDGWLVWQNGEWTRRPAPQPVQMFACTPSRDGRVWLATGDGLFVTGPDEPTHVDDFPWPATEFVHRMYEDASGRLWAAAGRRVCARDIDGSAGWQCQTLPRQVVHLVGLADVDGRLLAATATDGLYVRDDEAWTRVPGSDALGSRWLYALRQSSRGGVWVMGSGVAARVHLRDEGSDGLVIVEDLGRRHGLIDDGIHDLLERPDGSLWVAAASGLTRVPAHVRGRPSNAPKVAIVGAAVDGRALSVGETAQLAHEPGMIEISFAALAFTERERLRYRVRMSPDEPWSEPFDRPALQLYNPPAGDYAIEVAASHDGEHWSVAPQIVHFTVEAPIHQRPWFWLLVAAALTGLGYGLHRVRVAVRRRLAQQRLRIAMDLHDDLGSGLGSIGLVADLLTRPEFARDDTRRLAHDLRRTASELGDSLRSLVWTLRDDDDSLESLGVQLADRAATLLPGASPRLVTEFPTRWPAVELSLPVRRNLQLIAQEALHNAVRHASARTVTLGLRVVGGRGQLWVEDDGVGGVDLGASSRRMGLKNLTKRAEEIGAALTIGPGRDGVGTRVNVVFDPAANDRRLKAGRSRHEQHR